MAGRAGRIIRVVVVLLVLACLGGGVAYWLSHRGGPSGAAKYRTEAVSKGDITASVTATGTLSAVTTVQVGSQVSGIIATLHADYNSEVKKGQLLAELDPTPFEAQVAQRRADLNRAQVQMQNAEITFRRQERLSKELLVSDAELDAARAGYQVAKAEVDQSRAALTQTETNLKYAKILSPIDGVVVARQYDVGQTVAASFSAPTLFTIAQDLTKMQVQADVDQSDIGRVAVDQRARFTVDAYPEQDFRGRIAQIRLNATVNQTVITYPVMIEVANPDEKLRPQMTANVTIEVAKVRDVLRVPNAALRFRPEGQAPPSQGLVAGQGPSGPRANGGGVPAGGRGERGSWAAEGRGGGATSGPERRRERGEAVGSPAEPASSPGAPSASPAASPAATDDTASGPEAGGPRGRNARRTVAPVIYTLGPKGEPVPHTVKTGLSDGRLTEVESSDLHEGDMVIVGLATAKASDATRQAPGLGGGGGGGGGRRF